MKKYTFNINKNTLVVIGIALCVFVLLAPQQLTDWLAARNFTNQALLVETALQNAKLTDFAQMQKSVISTLAGSLGNFPSTGKDTGQKNKTAPQTQPDTFLQDFYAPVPNVMVSPLQRQDKQKQESVHSTVEAKEYQNPLITESPEPKDTSAPELTPTEQTTVLPPPDTEEKSERAEDSENEQDKEPFDFTKPLPVPEEGKIVVLLAGDSLMIEGMGAVLYRHLLAHPLVEVHREGVYSTGLCRDDYFDWPAHMEKLVEKHNPDLVILHIGANDGQDIVEEKKKRHIAGTKTWKQAYAKRATTLIKKATAKDAKVIWIGMPVMGQKTMSGYLASLGEEQENACSSAPDCLFINTTQTLAGSKGEFLTFWEEKDKTKTRIRSKDKIHVTEAGGKIMLRQIIPILDKLLPLPEDSNLETEDTSMANDQADSDNMPKDNEQAVEPKN